MFIVKIVQCNKKFEYIIFDHREANEIILTMKIKQNMVLQFSLIILCKD